MQMRSFVAVSSYL